jgi:hypothetical protein
MMREGAFNKDKVERGSGAVCQGENWELLLSVLPIRANPSVLGY